MSERSIRTRLSVLVSAGVLILAACGDDDSSGGGSTEGFCAALAGLADAPDGGDEENLALLREVGNAAPGEISDEFDTFVSSFESLQNLDLESADEDDMADFETMLADFDEATVAIESYAADNCPDLPDDFFTNE